MSARVEILIAAFVLIVVATGCGSATPTGESRDTPSPSASAASQPTSSTIPQPSVAGCVPECMRAVEGAIRSVPPGTFTTVNFFAGAFTIELGSGWTVGDSTNELGFEHPGSADWFIFAWIDPYPVSHLQRVAGIERTPEALIAWLHANETLIVTDVAPTTVAGGLPAAGVDLRVSDKAILEFPDCPDICTNYLGAENGPDAHGIARPGVTRIYFVPIAYGGQSHLLVITYETNDEATFGAKLSEAEQVIDTIRMPVSAGP